MRLFGEDPAAINCCPVRFNQVSRSMTLLQDDLDLWQKFGFIFSVEDRADTQCFQVQSMNDDRQARRTKANRSRKMRAQSLVPACTHSWE